MAQERIAAEGTQWLRELRDALDDVLIDVRFVADGEGYDFLLVHATGQRRAAIERFSAVFTHARDIPPFELISFEAGHVPEYYDEYVTIGTSPAHAE
jgi:hypothetical protein